MNPYYPGLVSAEDRKELRTLAERATTETLTTHEVEQLGCLAIDVLQEVADLDVLHALAVDHGAEVESLLAQQENENVALLEQTVSELARLSGIVEAAGAPVAAARLAGFSEGVRMLREIRGGKIVFERRPTDIVGLIDELRQYSGVPLKASCEPGLRTTTDRRRLNEVLAELVHLVGSRVPVSLEATRDGDDVLFAIGAQVKLDLEADLFEHFGMTVARKIARGLRGNLVRREVDGLVRFELRIPWISAHGPT